MKKNKLNQFRKSIDRIDSQLINILNKRGSLSIKIGLIKSKLKMPILTKKREIEIFKNIAKINSGPFENANLIKIYKSILKESRQLAKTKILDDKKN